MNEKLEWNMYRDIFKRYRTSDQYNIDIKVSTSKIYNIVYL